ncbi:MAG: acetylglutamate kinase [Methanobacteriota archaeon]|nr:MAG: acetylglutamate kinase [Euryarchaeota archaeon]
MRKIWEDHVTWTRLAIVSLVAGLADTNATVGRLMQNQADIGNAIRPFYGDAAGDHLTALLKDHIAIAAEIILAAKAGNQSGVDGARSRWYANADAIASFLSGANPKNWSPQMMQHMMHEHLDLTFQEAVAQLTGDYPASVAAYDAVHGQILGMADMLSAGIIDQFPQMFHGPVPA